MWARVVPEQTIITYSKVTVVLYQALGTHFALCGFSGRKGEDRGSQILAKVGSRLIKILSQVSVLGLRLSVMKQFTNLVRCGLMA